MVLCSGSWWVAGWISVGVWLVVGCGVARGGGSHFWSIPVVLGVGFFCCFVLRCSKTQCKIFSRAFS